VHHVTRWHRLGIPAAVAAGLILTAVPAQADPADPTTTPPATTSGPAVPTIPDPTIPTSPTSDSGSGLPAPTGPSSTETTPAEPSPSTPAETGSPPMCDAACAARIQVLINTDIGHLWAELFDVLAALAPTTGEPPGPAAPTTPSAPTTTTPPADTTTPPASSSPPAESSSPPAETPTPTTPSQWGMHPGPAGQTVIFADNFDSGLNCRVWTRLQDAETAAATQGSACPGWTANTGTRLTFPPGPNGGKVARFEVRPGDRSANGERAELSGDGAAWSFHEGDERWLTEKIMVDPATRFDVNNRFIILNQLHTAVNDSPPLVLGLMANGDLQLRSNGSGTLPDRVLLPAAEFVRGTWYTVTLHFITSLDEAKGGAEAWVNGVQRLPWANGKTMSNNRSYLKVGIYRNGQPDPAIVSYDDLVLTAP
jgi:hypothetical protein